MFQNRLLISKVSVVSSLGFLAVATAIPGLTGQAAADQQGLALYKSKIKPILASRCLPCHTGSGGSGGLDLTRRASILAGGVSGPAVNLTKTSDSLILRFINYHEARKMPPQGKIPKVEIDLLTKWVAMGLPMPDKATPGANPATDSHSVPEVNAQTKNFWAFRPVKRPSVPSVKNAAWVRVPLDAFILAKLEKNSLTPATPLSRAAWLRRVTYDLIGLPPKPEETRAFLADKTPKAYEKVVDRLLASPHYGEKWGRHWLDLVRYAETNSFERDSAKPFAYRYRDYVIKSLNDDKPYDVFLREQLAGDELDKVTAETLTATGFYRLGQWDDEPADPEQARYDELDDIIATTTQTMLGLTVNCARCHDHKLDPIPQKDYYRLLAFFQNIRRYQQGGWERVDVPALRVIATEDERKNHADAVARWRAQIDPYDKAIADVDKKVAPSFAPVEVQEFRDEAKRPEIIKKRVPQLVSEQEFTDYVKNTEARRTLRDNPPPGMTRALGVSENKLPVQPTHILARGNPHALGPAVTPGFLSVLSPPEPVIKPKSDGTSSGRRRALAEWITSPKHPLTARVMANRLFQHHFGRGIVRSASNFGRLGDSPTHPELLDYLATELIKCNWRLKPMHRMITLSSAYRMSSQGNKVALAKDPENNLLWRVDMRRLAAEEIRDSILAANGTLNPTLYGPSVYPRIPPEVLAGQSVPGSGWDVNSGPEHQTRRSIYTHIKRSLALPMLASFDAADTDSTCPVRFATTQPTQALTMLNSPFMAQQADDFASSLQASAGSDPKAQVTQGLWRALQRPPTEKEIARGVAFLRETVQQSGASPKEALRRYCLILLNLNEFMYLD
ncbi:MAG: PSD1 and planctomycete cytochrome C domain-containing protein [Fimbriimonas sp.]